MNPLIMANWHATRGGGFSGIVSFTRYGSGQEFMDSAQKRSSPSQANLQHGRSVDHPK